MNKGKDSSTVIEEAGLSEKITEQLTDAEKDARQRAELDKLLADAAKAQAPSITLPEMLGTFQQVEGLDGLYALPLCIETEIIVNEVFERLPQGESTSNMLKAGVAIAAGILRRVVLSEDPSEARAQLIEYIRTGDDSLIFKPVSETEVSRMFKSSNELTERLLKPLGIWKSEAAPDPNE